MFDVITILTDSSSPAPRAEYSFVAWWNRVQKFCRGSLLLNCVALLLLLTGCRAESIHDGLVSISYKGKPIAWVELAITPEQRATGLMYRTGLEPNCGMLFVFERKGMQSFWMKNCKIPLDLAYLADDGTITKIHHMSVEAVSSSDKDYPGYPSKERVRFVLEMAAGWFESKGIKEGDRFDSATGYW